MAKFWYGAGFKVISLIIWPQSIVETYCFSSNGVCHAYPYFCQTTVIDLIFITLVQIEQEIWLIYYEKVYLKIHVFLKIKYTAYKLM